jgi:hypothetical protein
MTQPISPKKFIYHIYLIQKYRMQKEEKTKSRSPINSKRAEKKKVRDGRKPKQAKFQSAEGPRRARGLKDRVCRIFVQARVAKGQKVQLSLENISTMWSFDVQGYCPVTNP